MTSDLRHSLRVLLRHRRTTLAVLLMLAIGLGANAALFTVINAAFLRPLPFRDPGRLVFLYASYPGLSAADLANFSYPDFEDLRRSVGAFEAVAAQSDFTAAAIEGRDGPARVQPNFVEGPYFDVLGTAPSIGRAFTDREMREGSPVMILSHGAWYRLFGGDPAIVGRAVRMNGLAFEVVGVMPERFFDLAEREGRSIDLWAPLTVAPRVVSTFDPRNRSGRLLWGIARLRDGETADRAERELSTLSARLEERYPATNRGFGIHARPVRDIFFTEMRLPLRLLAAGALFVLLIVCCNVAVLLLARSAARQREFAIRLALGASPARIARQLMVESLLLALAAAAGSLVVANWGTRALLAYGGVEFPEFVEVGLDRTVLGVVGTLAGLSGLAAGLVPASTVARRAVRERLSGAASPQVAQRPTTQMVLAGAQISAAIVLVAGAWLMMRSSLDLAGTGLNFDTDRLMTMRIDVPADRYGQPEERASFGLRLRERLASVPGVESATVWGPGTPGRATWVAFVAPLERVVQSPADFQMVWRHSTNPGGLGEMGIRLLEGRDFTTADSSGQLPVAIVGWSVARELWPTQSPIGRRIRTGTAPDSPVATVIGVADDVWMRGRFRFTDLDPRRIPQRDIYFPYVQRPQSGLVMLVRLSNGGAATAAALRAAVAELDPLLPAYDLRTMDEILRDEERGVRFAALLMAGYGAMALSIAAVGLYAVLAFAVLRRTREIGLRMALGAARGRVVAQVTRSGLGILMAGTVTGLAVIGILSPVVRSLFFNVSPLDPAVLAGACAVLLAAGALACALPAWRAASIDPALALRQD